MIFSNDKSFVEKTKAFSLVTGKLPQQRFELCLGSFFVLNMYSAIYGGITELLSWTLVLLFVI
jgi:hypothetical protein